METKNKSTTDTANREMTITRLLNAPRELVWEMFTNPEHIKHWWGPNGFTNTIYKMDVIPGGEWELTMHGPNGTDYWNKHTYTEVVKNEKLVHIHGPAPKFQMTILFIPQGNKTQLTITSLFDSAEVLQKAIEEFGAEEGFKQNVERLEAYLEKLPKERKLIITRILDAPRELVFNLWTDPKHLSQWWGPNGFTAPTCEMDLRPGGAIRIHMEHPDFPNHWMKGVFKEIVPPEKLVFTNGAFIGEDGEPGIDGVCTVTFEDYDGKTKMTLVAEVTKLAPQFSFAYEGMNEGWNQTLDKLTTYLNNLN